MGQHCFLSRDENISLGFIFIQCPLISSFGFPQKQTLRHGFRCRCLSGKRSSKAQEVVGKVEQERVSPKGPLNDKVPVHV